MIVVHEKLIKQLRNTEHCSGCPYDEDCNEFDSCLMDLLAADAIEDMSKKIAKLENDLHNVMLSFSRNMYETYSKEF